VGGATYFCSGCIYRPCISIHAPRGGSDFAPLPFICSMRISIHAPRGGSDLFYTSNKQNGGKDFNPRSPWGERPDGESWSVESYDFNPRSPWGERLFYIVTQAISAIYFNPRSPWGERLCTSEVQDLHINFNPRSPWGERLKKIYDKNKDLKFQSTLPVGGATGLYH